MRLPGGPWRWRTLVDARPGVVRQWVSCTISPATMVMTADTDEVHPVSKEYFSEAIGTLRAASRTEVAARIMAPINAVHVTAGDEVAIGDLLIELDRRDIDPSDITGYESEEFTHMAVAVAVVSGVADVGLGILSAARALDLDFLPVTSERYELVVPESGFLTEPIRRLLEVIRSDEFARRVSRLGGYRTSETGDVADL